LCKDWEAEHERFRTRSLLFHRYAYLFVDGVHSDSRASVGGLRRRV
jgi:transposase-like protein